MVDSNKPPRNPRGAAAKKTVDTKPARPQQPPWRWRAFRSVTAPAGLDDLAARSLLLVELERVDQMTNAEGAAAFGVDERTLYRARAWFRDTAPELVAHLRERDPVAFGRDRKASA